MRKTYISPFIIIEDIEAESELLKFSKEEVDIIGEGDETPESPGNGGDNESGEGLNSKKGGFFNFDWDD